METELLPKLKSSLSFKRPRYSFLDHASSTTVDGIPESPDSRENSDDYSNYRYTSLKDIILSSSPQNTAANHHDQQLGGSGFDISSIAIRNELVKHAASVYVQSAAGILVTRDQNCWLVRFWEKIKDFAAFRSCFHVYVRIPLRAVFRPILRFLEYVASRVKGRSGLNERTRVH